MRYEDWDVILFPTGRDAKIPFKEFKVACHTIPDVELAHIHGSVGVPVMTCFVPSLSAGTPFQISIHSWRVPKISQFARSYSKHLDVLKFEARILLDGQLVASATFDRAVSGPHLIASTFEFTKTGELERLKFPNFRRELLYQNHWNPGDDVGRIKIVISEGFPRDSTSMPIERVKNAVVFSFQHAPLGRRFRPRPPAWPRARSKAQLTIREEILESNGIAWPNPSMWRRSPFNPTMPVPTFQPEDGANSHSHSPRRRSVIAEGSKSQMAPVPFFNNSMIPPQASTGILGGQSFPMPVFSRTSTGAGSSLSFSDPFSESPFYDWTNSMSSSQWLGDGQMGRSMWAGTGRTSGRHSNTDTSMPDYIPNQGCEPMHISGPSLEDDPLSLKVPTNTPTTGPAEDFQGISFPFGSYAIPPEFAASLTHSLLNQPMPMQVQPQNIPLPSSDVKSRKENRHLSFVGSNPASAQSTPHAMLQMRKFSQPLFSMTGNFNTSVPLTIDTSVVNSNPNGLSTSPPPIFSATVSRTTSGGDFGANITNLSTGKGPAASPMPSTHPSVSDNGLKNTSPSTFSGSMGGCCGGTKRGRDFTPTSLKAIGGDDESRRASPHVRITGFGGDVAREA